MAKVLISFIGKGRMEDKQTRRYVPTTYAFSSDPGGNVSVSLFGAGLLQHLSRTEGLIERWLVVGTEQSMWEALLDAVPKERRDEVLLSSHRRIGECVQACTDGKAALDETVLEQWQKDLTDRLDGTECRCRVVGSCDTLESQQKLWQALDEGVPLDSSVCMDVTHCYRILPILGSFMVMFLRWERSVKDIDLVYGAWEMRRKDGICPVIHLPLCNELLQASEAVATLRYTGNYVPLAAAAGLDPSVQSAVARLAFLDEVQPLHSAATKVLATLPSPTTVPEVSLVQRLSRAIQVSTREDLPKRMRDRAKRAWKQRQYQQATLLLFEAILEAGITRFTHETPGTKNGREKAEAKIREWVEKEGLKKTFWALKSVRNRVAHGSDDEVPPRVREALIDPQAFDQLFSEGFRLLDQLLRIEPGTRP